MNKPQNATDNTTGKQLVEILSFDHNEASMLLFGEQNQNLKTIEKELSITIYTRGGDLTLRGDAEKIRLGVNLINQLYELAENRFPLKPNDIVRAVSILENNPNERLKAIFLATALIATSRNKSIAPKTPAQKRYLEAIALNDLVFSTGPAGTGKTYLAMAMGVTSVLKKDFKRIILTRPAVEAGEKLGFLPGDLIEKVNPYLRPLYDALYDMIDLDKVQHWMSNGTVEVAPLAFMRGRTLNDSFIILDEAQNTTKEQMKMFLTRMGNHSKAVVTGDITQVDLPFGQESGLVHAVGILEKVEGIGVCRFSDRDVVRHPLVQRIVRAYEHEPEK